MRNMSEEVTDPKLLKYIKKGEKLKSTTKPNLTKIKDVMQRPDPSVSITIVGEPPTKIEPEVVLTVYKCNKCERTFNHTPRQVAAGIMPTCPDCDR